MRESQARGYSNTGVLGNEQRARVGSSHGGAKSSGDNRLLSLRNWVPLLWHPAVTDDLPVWDIMPGYRRKSANQRASKDAGIGLDPPEDGTNK